MLFTDIRMCPRFRIRPDALEEAVEPTGKPSEEREKATEASQLAAKELKPILETGVALRVLTYPWLRSTAVVTRSSSEELSALSLVACWAFAIASLSLNAAGSNSPFVRPYWRSSAHQARSSSMIPIAVLVPKSVGTP